MSATVISTYLPTGHWSLDPDHTRLGFEVKHLGISTVRGRFARFDGELATADGTVAIRGRAEAASIDTGNPDRDEHLRSADFFHAEHHPYLTLSADRVQGDEVVAALTIRDVTREVVFTLEDVATGEDDEGRQKLALTATAKLRRTDFGLTWNQIVGGGKLLVGETVRLVLDVAAFRVDD